MEKRSALPLTSSFAQGQFCWFWWREIWLNFQHRFSEFVWIWSPADLKSLTVVFCTPCFSQSFLFQVLPAINLVDHRGLMNLSIKYIPPSSLGKNTTVKISESVSMLLQGWVPCTTHSHYYILLGIRMDSPPPQATLHISGLPKLCSMDHQWSLSFIQVFHSMPNIHFDFFICFYFLHTLFYHTAIWILWNASCTKMSPWDSVWREKSWWLKLNP